MREETQVAKLYMDEYQIAPVVHNVRPVQEKYPVLISNHVKIHCLQLICGKHTVKLEIGKEMFSGWE
jgi:hypothetical protein